MAVTEERPLRADARRNRAAIVKAARTVFARKGREAQMDDVARRAKVGVGTVYRHFPTKEALLAAIASDRFNEFAGYAEEELAGKDGFDAFEAFIRRCAAVQASDRLLTQMLAEQPELMAAAATGNATLIETTTALVERAQAAGEMRADARPPDIGMIMCALGRADAPPKGSWERMLAIILDGLRAAAARNRLPE